ncbi:hypothetical protein F5Y04DRAFT_278697 [Hypomontagnella monticulosa]|nr:hypothetical protein F5Y04DRAFT_278697 [Hypomontagnella monticulosa]
MSRSCDVEVKPGLKLERQRFTKAGEAMVHVSMGRYELVAWWVAIWLMMVPKNFTISLGRKVSLKGAHVNRGQGDFVKCIALPREK